MTRFLYAIALAVSLSGCAHQLDNRWVRDFISPTALQATSYNFDWQISGEPSLAPLQVFDDGKKVWLQFADMASTPAIFASVANGERLLFPKQTDKYLVLDMVPDTILLRGGLLKTELRRIQPKLTTNLQVKPVNMQADDAVEVRKVIAPTNKPITPAPKLAKKNKTQGLIAQAITIKGEEFNVSPKDGNIRKALKKWSELSAWTFTDEHWDVDVDIPLAGSASFGANYQFAVRELLAATELGDRPLQPCFYSNKVLRVIAMADRCDRTVAAGTGL